jgi:hypothetical protein
VPAKDLASIKIDGKPVNAKNTSARLIATMHRGWKTFEFGSGKYHIVSE